MEVKPSDIRLAGMDLLARREHSSKEIVTKLKRRFGKRLEGDDLIRDVVDQLTNEGLLSDERYAESMARQLVNRGSGPSKVAYELRQKGCDPDVALSDAFPDGVDWFAVAEEVFDRKFGAKVMPEEWDLKTKRASQTRTFYGLTRICAFSLYALIRRFRRRLSLWASKFMLISVLRMVLACRY